jgi:hypothetical protein
MNRHQTRRHLCSRTSSYQRTLTRRRKRRIRKEDAVEVYWKANSKHNYIIEKLISMGACVKKETPAKYVQNTDNNSDSISHKGKVVLLDQGFEKIPK